MCLIVRVYYLKQRGQSLDQFSSNRDGLTLGAWGPIWLMIRAILKSVLLEDTETHYSVLSGSCVYGTGSEASNEFSELDDELVTLQAVFLMISKSDIRRTRFGSPAHPSMRPPVMQFQ